MCTKCNTFFISKWDSFITKCDSYHKMRRLLQIATVHQNPMFRQIECEVQSGLITRKRLKTACCKYLSFKKSKTDSRLHKKLWDIALFSWKQFNISGNIASKIYTTLKAMFLWSMSGVVVYKYSRYISCYIFHEEWLQCKSFYWQLV